MSAVELRQATETLRGRAGAASPAPWRAFEHHGRDITDEGWSEIGAQNDGHTVAITYPTGFENDYPEPDAAYIATMHPGVGLALADWLDFVAAGREAIDGIAFARGESPTCSDLFRDTETHALALARLINGGAA